MYISKPGIGPVSGCSRRPLSRLVTVVSCVLLCAVWAVGQGTRGTIRGTVSDPNGAVVAGATVKLVDAARQQEIRTVQTDQVGNYQFLELDPATYVITISATGFAETRLNDVKVDPNRNLQLDTKLSVGGTAAEVTVTGTQELIDRETPTLGTNVENRRVQGLPLNGRNPLDLALLQPGVAPVFQPTAGTTAFGTGLGIRVNGGRGVENNVQLDGSNNNEVPVGAAAGGQPRPDAVQEFRLLTANFEAEFGRNTGSVINIVTKSGTNEYHGNVRFFYRPTFLSAARYFDNQRTTGLRRPDDFRRIFERKEYGGNIGGPISLPHFGEGDPTYLKGKNKAFFFVDYERRAQLIGDSRQIAGIPTLAERQGFITVRNFDVNHLPILIRDPATATAGNNLGTPFPVISGNPATPFATVVQQIPTTRFSPIAQYYLGFLPVPNPAGQASSAANETTNNKYLTTRVDYMINNAQTLNFTFNFFDQNILSPFAFGGPPNGASVPGFGSIDARRTYNYVLRHTYTISPNLVNTVLFGVARNQQPSLSPDNKTTPQEIGFTANFVANQQFAGPPMLRIFDRGINIGNTFQGPQARVASNFQLQDAVSYGWHDHRFKFGFDGTKFLSDQTFLFVNQGIITMSATVGSNTTGDDLADTLLGNSPAAIQFGANGLRDFRQLATAAFAQDTWRFNDKLTLSLGVRWEYTSPLTDKFNRVAYYTRSLQRSQLLTSGQLRSFEGLPITVPAGRTAPRGLLYVGDPDPDLGGNVPTGGVAKDWNNWAPRFGFAYSPASKEGTLLRRLLGDRHTVFRGGFGIFYGSVIGDTVLQQLSAPGYAGTNQFTATGTGTLADPFAADPFPLFCNGTVAGIPQGSCRNNEPAIANPFAVSQLFVFPPIATTSQAIDPHIRTPYVMQWNFTTERSLFSDYALSFSYVGNRGRKLYVRQVYNPAFGTTLPFPAGISLPITTGTANINSRRINTDFTSSLAALTTAGTSDYNALEVNFQKRYSKGLLYQIAYTFSKSMTDADTQRGQLDASNRLRGYALSSDDVPHRLVGSFIYDLPFGKHFSGIGKRFFDGWSIGGIYTIQSGTPFSVANLNNTTADGGATLNFADLGAPFTNLDPRQNANRAFNADAFKNAILTGPISATNFRFGTSGPNQFRLKNGINNFDFILSKKTRLWGESSNLELRFEAFNFFNHTQFATVDLNLANQKFLPSGAVDPASTFGKFLSARESRVIQLGARLSF